MSSLKFVEIKLWIVFKIWSFSFASWAVWWRLVWAVPPKLPRKTFYSKLALIVQVNITSFRLSTKIELLFCRKNLQNSISLLSSVLLPVAAVDGWRKFLEKERQYVDKPGLPHHKKLVDATKAVEEILIKNEHPNTLKLFEELIGYGAQLLPHIKNERAHQIHSEIIDDIRKLIADHAANKLGKDDMHNFIRKTYKSISAF